MTDILAIDSSYCSIAIENEVMQGKYHSTAGFFTDVVELLCSRRYKPYLVIFEHEQLSKTLMLNATKNTQRNSTNPRSYQQNNPSLDAIVNPDFHVSSLLPKRPLRMG